MKQTLIAFAAATGLIGLPVTPAAAAGPLLFAPMVLGHVLGAMARLATLPLLAGAQTPAPAYYPPQQGYYAGPQPYYPPYNQPYYQPYYQPPPYGFRPAPQYYAPPRRDYVPYARYAGSHGPPIAQPYGGSGYGYGGSGYRYGGSGYRYGGYGYRRR
jgi:hypothetical protein